MICDTKTSEPKEQPTDTKGAEMFWAILAIVVCVVIPLTCWVYDIVGWLDEGK
jgi:hypothetical protein